jgi:cytochrome c-type biogenesis protein CcmH/NrfG
VLAKLVVRAGVALACAAAVVVSLKARDSRIDAEVAFGYYAKTKDGSGALARFEAARPLNPNYQIDVVESRLRPEQGAEILRRVLRKEPENVELWLRLSQRQVIDGDRAEAERSYARARSLAPSFLPADGPPPGF